MSTSAPITPAITADEFQALEQKVLRAVEIVRNERAARAAAEAEVARLQQQLTHQLEDQRNELEHRDNELAAERARHTSALDEHTASHRSEISTLEAERLEVRRRVESMLKQMDELL